MAASRPVRTTAEHRPNRGANFGRSRDTPSLPLSLSPSLPLSLPHFPPFFLPPSHSHSLPDSLSPSLTLHAKEIPMHICNGIPSLLSKLIHYVNEQTGHNFTTHPVQTHRRWKVKNTAEVENALSPSDFHKLLFVVCKLAASFLRGTFVVQGTIDAILCLGGMVEIPQSLTKALGNRQNNRFLSYCTIV